MTVISKHTAELRFKADGTILDRKGQIASTLVDGSSLFDHWSIADRVELRVDENPNIKAFISHKNLGVASWHPNTSELFKEQVSKFIQSAWVFFYNRP
jgi:hypothetical protein